MKKILLVLLICVTYSFANIGKITAVKGEVYIVRDAKQIIAKSGSILILKDQVQTKQKAKALVLFNDNTSITVGNNSKLSVNEFVLDIKNPKKSKTNFGFGKGVFRTITGRIGKINPKGFKIKTKSASIGIRGTTLDTSVKILPSGAEQVQVAFLKGHGVITSDTTGIETPVNTGQNASMNQNGETQVKQGPLAESKKMDNESKELEEESKNTKQDNSNNNTKDDKKSNSNGEQKTKSDDGDGPGGDNPEGDGPGGNVPSGGDVPPLPDLGPIDILVDESNDDDKKDALEDAATDSTSSGRLDGILDSYTKISMCSGEYSCDHYEYLDYGFLVDEQGIASGVYYEGTLTEPSVITGYFSNPPQTGSYSGGVTALVTDLSNNQDVVGGTIDLNFAFSTQSLTGEIHVYEPEIIDLVADINSGTITSGGFNSSDITSTDTPDLSGVMSGNFFGPNAEAAGGVFQLISPSEGSVIGGFSASQNMVP